MNQGNFESVEDSNALQIYFLDIKTASYIWYNLLLEILLSTDYLSSRTVHFMNLFNILENIISSDDEYSSNLISQFEQTYELQQVVYWLTSDTPLIRIVNKALHEQDINMLFTLCFLLVNIYTQLIKHQADSLNAFSYTANDEISNGKSFS
ncbi:unnamed protein product [Rotaria sp. Silwood2]|nr:unnamed protein product [Rotaria sp. Silwood2]